MADFRNIVAYMRSTGVAHRVTDTIRPAGTKTAAGKASCHAEDNERCDAIDVAGPSYGNDSPELGAIFWAFEPVFHQMHELIYAGPQTTFNIKGGKKVPPYATAGHHDHVHAAILATTTLPIGDDDMPLDTTDKQWIESTLAAVEDRISQRIKDSEARQNTELKSALAAQGSGATGTMHLEGDVTVS